MAYDLRNFDRFLRLSYSRGELNAVLNQRNQQVHEVGDDAGA